MGPVQERWVEALLLPGAEMRGQGEELVELAVQIARWGGPLDRRPKREFGDHAPPISLPAGGVGFWEGRPLPKASPCPEIPRRPAGILERLGGFPDWPGDRPLGDWLAPVYEAASRYALDHAFGRKV